MSSIANQQIFEPIFEMFGVDVFRDGLVCQVASNFLFRLSVSHVGRMNTQVWLLNSLVRLVGRVNSELVGSIRNTEWMIRQLYAIFTVQFKTESRNTSFLKCLSFFYFLNTYTLLRAVHCLHKLLLARIALFRNYITFTPVKVKSSCMCFQV